MDRPPVAPGVAWQPAGPPATAVTYRPWVRFGVGAVMAVILAGLLIAVVDAVRAGDAGEPFKGSDLPTAGIVIGWVLVALFILLLLMAVGQLLMFRVELWPDGFVARAYVRRYVVALGELQAIDVRAGRQNAYNPVQATPVLSVKARDRFGRRRGFLLTASYQRMDGALPVVDEWVRRRPDLLTDAARAVFQARGLVPPQQPSTTPPRIEGFRTRDGGHFDTSA